MRASFFCNEHAQSLPDLPGLKPGQLVVCMFLSVPLKKENVLLTTDCTARATTSSSLRLRQDNGSQKDPELTQAGKVQGPHSVSPSPSHKHWLLALHMKTFNDPDFSQTQITHKHIDTQTAQLKLRVARCGFRCKCSETQGN